MHHLILKAMGIFLTTILLFSLACGTPAEPPPLPPFALAYDLEEPVATQEMEKELEEISGLTLSRTQHDLLAVQDEDGVIFYLKEGEKDIQKELSFWKDGDYEGIEAVGDAIYVVNSSGTVFRVRGDDEERLSVDKFNGFLNQSYDVEGLGYDPEQHRLLLACKGMAGKGDAYKFKKAVYAFDLNTLTFQEEPVYLISLENVQAYLQTSPSVRKLEKLLDAFSLSKSDFVFGPSGIAVHPETGHHYITSAVGKLLMVVSPQGEVLHLEKLKSKVHPQPEGICFGADGTLYIANEGRGDDGLIHTFRLRQ